MLIRSIKGQVKPTATAPLKIYHRLITRSATSLQINDEKLFKYRKREQFTLSYSTGITLPSLLELFCGENIRNVTYNSPTVLYVIKKSPGRAPTWIIPITRHLLLPNRLRKRNISVPICSWSMVVSIVGPPGIVRDGQRFSARKLSFTVDKTTACQGNSMTTICDSGVCLVTATKSQFPTARFQKRLPNQFILRPYLYMAIHYRPANLNKINNLNICRPCCSASNDGPGVLHINGKPT